MFQSREITCTELNLSGIKRNTSPAKYFLIRQPVTKDRERFEAANKEIERRLQAQAIGACG